MKFVRLMIILAVISAAAGAGNYGLKKYWESDDLAIYRKLHSPTPGTYYQVSDIGVPAQDGGKQFLYVIELATAVTNTTKSGESVVELRPTGKYRQIEVPTMFTGAKSLGSIVTTENGRARYFVNSHEAVKNLLGIRNEKP